MPRSAVGGTDTADFPEADDPVKPGPGNLRLSYVLPDARMRVTGAGVYWPEKAITVAAASRHRLVWVDVTRP